MTVLDAKDTPPASQWPDTTEAHPPDDEQYGGIFAVVEVTAPEPLGAPWQGRPNVSSFLP